MFLEDGGRPGDRRGFLHKSIVGKAVGGLVKKTLGATPIGVAVGTGLSIAGGLGFGRRQDRSLSISAKFPELDLGGHNGTPHHGPGGRCLHGESIFDCGRRLALGLVGGNGGGNGCRPDESSRCCRLRNGTTSDQAEWQRSCGVAGVGAGGMGAATTGRYGAALEPGTMVINRAVCERGMTLGDDGLCYNKGAITNKQRMWPRGRRPLLTGGDMSAISTAARAGSKMDRATKRLRAMGMMKPLPKPRGKPAAHAHAKPVAAVSV